MSVKLLLAPVVIYAWVWMGVDGTTLKAGQVLLAGQNPVEQPQSARHGVMIGWHRLCDALLGDVTRRP